MGKVTFKDVAHLYLNCEVKIEGHDNATLGAVGIKNGEQVIVRWGGEEKEWSYADISEIKPLLLPLSKMTEDDIKFIRSFSGEYQSYGLLESIVKADAPIVVYLLSKGYDLFDLISSGEALDKTENTKL